MTIISSSSSSPRVSVVMSIYNEAERVGLTLERLQQQTFKDVEWILVDDGSTDETAIILERFKRLDSRIRVIRQENTGLTLALIRGCREACGEYIARHDADDWSEFDRLANQVALLDSDPAIGLVSCTTQYVGPHGEELELIIRDDSPVEATRKLLDERQGPPAHGSVMFRRSLYEAVGGYRPEFYFGQDADLWMRMAEQSLIAYDRRKMYSLRRDPSSTSGKMGTIQQEYGRWGQACRAARREGRSELAILDEARSRTAELRAHTHDRAMTTGQATMAYMIGTTLSRRRDLRAREYFWKTICLSPLFWKAWLRLIWEVARPSGNPPASKAE